MLSQIKDISSFNTDLECGWSNGKHFERETFCEALKIAEEHKACLIIKTSYNNPNSGRYYIKGIYNKSKKSIEEIHSELINNEANKIHKCRKAWFITY